MSASLSAFEQQAVAALASRADLAARLLSPLSQHRTIAPQTARSLVQLAQLGVTEERGAEEVLNAAAGAGLVRPAAGGYLVDTHDANTLARVAFALHAIAYYQANVHRDATEVRVVLTKPPQPSALEQQLAAAGWHTQSLEATDQAFRRMVQTARQRVVVMTPFFDRTGARWLTSLLGEVAPNVTRILVLRGLEQHGRPAYPEGYTEVATWLMKEGVQVFNYSLPRAGGGRETFHAKVVLCDADLAYIGSSNVNAASLEHSMEMGVEVTGKAARHVSVVIEAVLAASVQVL